MGYVISVLFSILVNGVSKGHITLSKGLRHGDSLSSYLFLLCIERLISLLSNPTNEITGIKVSKDEPPINNLPFTDDNVIFSKADLETTRKIQQLLCL